ncbi:Uncharacterised protein [Burkholderia pseudomallei]|nr:Uncharacterised protein [Burkholderia pseudomallei]
MSDIVHESSSANETPAQALDHCRERTKHLAFEVMGVVLAVSVVVVLYGLIWGSGGRLAHGGCEGLVSLVHHAVGSVFVSFLTIDAFLVGCAMIVSGSLFATLLYEYACKSILRLFIHSCAFSLGTGVGYVILMWPRITPRGEFPSVVEFCLVLACAAALATWWHLLMESIKRQHLELWLAAALRRMLPAVAEDENALRRWSVRVVSIAGLVAGGLLVWAALHQLPDDLSSVQRADAKHTETLNCVD